MSNVRKSVQVSCDTGNGGYFVQSGKIISGVEYEENVQKSIEDNERQILDYIADADTMLRHSLTKSCSIVKKAKSEAAAEVENAVKQGYESGYSEGLAQGLPEGQKLSEKDKKPVVEALSQFSDRFSEYCGKMTVDRDGYLDKALELAARIIYTELKKDDGAFFGLYKKAALHVSNTDTAELCAGPRGYEAAQAAKSEYEDAIEGLGSLKITRTGDDDGTCILKTPLGNIDASVGTQLSRAKRIISPQG